MENCNGGRGFAKKQYAGRLLKSEHNDDFTLKRPEFGFEESSSRLRSHKARKACRLERLLRRQEKGID